MDIKKLEAAALAAIPSGEWFYSPWFIEEGPPVVRKDGYGIVCTTASDCIAAFIAAFNPATALELIAEIERLRAAVGGGARESQPSGWNAAIEAAAEAMGRQHVWITNTAAASVIRTLLRPAAQEAAPVTIEEGVRRANATLTAFEVPQEVAREQPATDQAKRIQELEAQLDTMERLKDLSQEALQELRAKFDAARREAFEQALGIVWKVTDHETATEISKKVCTLQPEASVQGDERKDALLRFFVRQVCIKSGIPEEQVTEDEVDAAIAEIEASYRALAEKGESHE